MLSLESQRIFQNLLLLLSNDLFCYIANHLMAGSLGNRELEGHGSAVRRISSVSSSNPVLGQVLSRYLYPPRYINRYQRFKCFFPSLEKGKSDRPLKIDFSV